MSVTDDPHLLQEVLFNTDSNELMSFCQANQLSLNICSRKDFWEEYFKRAGLLLLQPLPKLQDYVANFQTSKRILVLVDEMIAMLTHRFPEDPDIPVVLATNAANPKDFEVDGIDYPKFLSFCTQCQHSAIIFAEENIRGSIQRLPGDDWLEFRTLNGPSVIFSYLPEPGYQIEAHFEADHYFFKQEYPMSQNQMRTLLYILISRGYRFEWIMNG